MSLRYELRKFCDSLSRPLERWTYRLARVDLQSELNCRKNAFQRKGSKAGGEAMPPLAFDPLR
jgi:hypothetical protein